MQGKDKKNARADVDEDSLETKARICSKEVGIDYASADKLLKGNLSIRSREAKCFVRCFFKQQGFMNDKEELQNNDIVDALVGKFPMPRHKIKRVVEKCSSRFRSDDSCENAFLVSFDTCARNKQHYKLILIFFSFSSASTKQLHLQSTTSFNLTCS